MNCIFYCVFNQVKYVDMFLISLESLIKYGNLDKNTNVLIYTSTLFMNMIKQNTLFDEEKIKFEINDSFDDITKACVSRLNFFILQSSKKYSKILYLDTDIIVKDDINKVLRLCEKDILYVLEEGVINNEYDYYGRSLFGDELSEYQDKTAFTSGILLFKNCEKISELFQKINSDILMRPRHFYCYDQPYIVYNTMICNLYDNQILKDFVVNNDANVHSNKIIHHFPGITGVYQHKITIMTDFLNQLRMIR